MLFFGVFVCFFFNDTATTEIYTLSLHDALPISADFCGHPKFRWRLLPSTSPAEPVFEPHNYWRGPVWPVISWLLWRSLSLLGCGSRAEALRLDSLDQIASAGEFGEYFDPFTGAPLGSVQQSWTAAVVLDWSAADPDCAASKA